ncbi:CHC2 zinc finger domain-containing protein [Leptospira weilii]|uniref:CHC2 zinc finger domain-containing protein n=1 Tax=Leptospira weilii TaxID=28184 RepID=UPI00201B901C|nr:CHC2 zinc finger domain-containing protein [Leptospira weilii]UPY76974.1 CHC2 zinc finger domain-containing protein [Leptospira weilii]UPY76990.1 CHC2 zinc finger domain-containing protein [Leptospira weilii]UPY80423.1 CHC2 zinc finger domain-containing protein [Leptospira weilii]
MAFIPKEEITRLKTETDLLALVRSYGIELRKHGLNWLGRCPFHEDKTPSFVVTPTKQLWHCMGACQTGGSAIDFLMKREGLGFNEAVEALQKLTQRTQMQVSQEQTKEPREETTRKRYGDFPPEEQRIIDRVFTYYQETLTKNKEAKEYLKNRGVYDREALEKFQIGYVDGSMVGQVLPRWDRKEGREARRVLREYGLARESKGYERFYKYIIFPLLDENGKPVGVYGRNISSGGSTTVRHRYMPGPHTGIWNREAICEKELILCESVIDALTMYVNGIRNVTCSYGVEGYTEELHREIGKHKPVRILIAYDNDPGGNAGAQRLMERYEQEGLRSGRIRLPVAMDVNEYAQKVRNAGDSLHALVLDTLPNEKETPTERTYRKEEERTQETTQTLPNRKEEKATFQKENMDKTTVTDLQSVPLSPPRLKVERKGEEIHLERGERQYRVRSLYKNQGMEVMRVNLRLLVGEEYHTETLDMMNPKMRKGFVQSASDVTGELEETINSDLKEVFRESEEALWEKLENRRKPQKEEVTLSPEETGEAIQYLQDPELVTNILLDFERMGLVGERENSLLGYLATITRRTENPLAVIVQSSSSAGKSTLMDAILDLVPGEEKEKYSAMTGQSLFYMSATSLKNKVLAISEEEGVERAKYALKILQSEKKISIATTTKDQQSGRLSTTEYTVEGPVVLFLTTTSVEIDEELQNRAIVLTVNEDREQTRTILTNQRTEETLEGVFKQNTKEKIVTRHQNIQRLLKSIAVVNPYAKEIKFPDTRLRMRRDQKKYLTLIRSIALLHQYQREEKTAKDAKGKEIPYIEVEKEDIALASLLFSRIFGRNLEDLSAHTKRLLQEIHEYVEELCKTKGVTRSEIRLTRKEIRERTGVSDTRLRVHLKRLEELEYLYVRNPKQGTALEYELVWDKEADTGNDFYLGMRTEEFEEATKKLGRIFSGEKQPSVTLSETNPASFTASSLAESTQNREESGDLAGGSLGVAPPSPRGSLTT